MYRIGHRKKRIRHHVVVISLVVFVIAAVTGSIFWLLLLRSDVTYIEQTEPGTQTFDPEEANKNVKIDTPLYTMELPKDWKQISQNKDDRYASTEWQLQTGMSNRWIELYTDRIPPEKVFNKIIPVTISNNVIVPEAASDNCIKFTQSSSTSLIVASKWQNAPFLCDFSHWNDNIVGVSEKNKGTVFSLTGPSKGTHTYMFVYTDRGIPEDSQPIITALSTLRPK